MRKMQILMNKPVYLGLSILYLSKTVIYEFWYENVKPKYGENEKNCFMDAGSLIVCVKTDDIYKDIVKDVETRLNTSDFKLEILIRDTNERWIRWKDHKRICWVKIKIT